MTAPTTTSRYRCRLHPDEATTWRGTGCPRCAQHPLTTQERRAARDRRRATDPTDEGITPMTINNEKGI